MLTGTVFDHVLIVVKDLDRAIEFYRLLGFKHVETIQRPRDQVGVIKLGPVKIELMCQREGLETYGVPRRTTDIGFRHIGLKVDDVEEVYGRLKDVIEFDSQPKRIDGREGRVTVFFRDPDGVELHFVQQ